MELDKVLQEDKNIVEKHLEKLLDIKVSYSQKIIEAMRYSLMAGGKRLRPVLLIETLKAFNVDFYNYIDIACSLEMIHTYSLIHDDLPAMDNDNLRRGKPTNHIKFGEDIAILAGDSLLNFAYEKLFDFLANNPSSNNIKACQIIAKYSGIYGMIGGQVSDVINENEDISIENLEYIHENKTAKLLMASILSAAYLANASTENMECLKDYSYNLGMAFQISDDILDIIGDEQLLGKSTGKDEKSGKNTYPKYFGIEKSKEKLKQYLANAKTSISNMKNFDNNFFIELLNYIAHRKY